MASHCPASFNVDRLREHVRGLYTETNLRVAADLEVHSANLFAQRPA